jgi:hypothetical protein
MCMVSMLAIAMLAPLLAQLASSSNDLAIELAEKVAARVASSGQIVLTVAGGDADETAGRGELRDAIVAALRARNVRVIDAADAATRVDVACGVNLRERTCVAEIRKGAVRDVVAVSRPHGASAENNGAIPLSLDWRPVFAQRDAFLDVALAGDRLFVLEPAAVVLYQRRDAGWQRTQTRPIPTTRTWPRDLRGRLWIEDAGVAVRLPGVTCRAALDLGNLACVEERQPWPIGIENAGLDATRNSFTTPEGLPFFGAAALGGGAGPRWLIADRSGLLTLLDGTRRAVATAGSGDDVVSLAAACAAGPHVLVVSPTDRQPETDTLRLLRVEGHRLVPAAAPVDVAAAVTALWAAPDAPIATAIVRDAGGERYEAVHIRIACDR